MALSKDTNRPAPDSRSGSGTNTGPIADWKRQGCHGHLAAVGFQTIVLAALNLWLVVFGLRALGPFESDAGGVGGRWTQGLTLLAVVAIVALIASLLLTMRGKTGRRAAAPSGQSAPGDPKDTSFEFSAWRFHSCRGQLIGAATQSIVLVVLGISLVFFGLRTLGAFQGPSGQPNNLGMRGVMLFFILLAVVLLLWFLQGNLRRMNNLRREIGRLRTAISPFAGLRLK